MKRLRVSLIVVALVSMLVGTAGVASANALCVTPVQPRYYPQIPAQITSPEMALLAYFDALYYASNLTAEQMGAVGGTVGSGREPYAQAYNYWSPAWQAENDYDTFVNRWVGTVHVALHRLCSLSEEGGTHRFFVETRHFEAIGSPVRIGIFYYSGEFTVAKVGDEWRITSGELVPQNPAWEVTGHQPWQLDPVQVAISNAGGAVSGAVLVDSEPGGFATVVLLTDNLQAQIVKLVQRLDGRWQVLSAKQVAVIQ